MKKSIYALTILLSSAAYASAADTSYFPPAPRKHVAECRGEPWNFKNFMKGCDASAAAIEKGDGERGYGFNGRDLHMVDPNKPDVIEKGGGR